MGNTWSIRTVTRIQKVIDLDGLQRSLSIFLCSYRVNSYCSLKWIDTGSSRHLLVEVFVEDKSCAFVLFAFPTVNDSSMSTFDYVLVRGAFNSGILPVFEFLKSAHGCLVSKISCPISPFQVKQIFSEVIANQSNIPLKPLELTYDTREYASSAGLDKITMTIPTGSVEKVYNVKKKSSLTLFEFIDDFFLKEFRIDIRRFPIIKAANGSLVVGCEGRLKVNHPNVSEIVLRKIRTVIIPNISSG